MNFLVINREDLKHNIKKIKEIASEKTKIIGVVKGNGYGIGLTQFANILIDNGINFLAVSTVEEAIELRKSNVETKILLLSSTAIKEEVEMLIKNDIVLTIGSKKDIEVAEEIASKLNKKIKAHLKIDTGFGRYGFCYTNKQEIVENISNLKNVEIEGTFSHFSASFYKTKTSIIQYNRFIETVDYLKQNNIETGMLHICNSSAFLKFENMRLDAVRIGSAFLGRISIPNNYGLKKIANFHSNVSEIKNVPKGYNIGYSNAYKTRKDTDIAIIPCGYATGFNVKEQRDMFRPLDNLRYLVRDFKDSLKDQSIYVNIQNKEGIYEKCKVLGRVGMYHISVDITGKNIEIGSEVKCNINPIFVDSSIRREYI